jgi:two-component system NtrC family sensor kinase
MGSTESELALLRFLGELTARLGKARDPEDSLRFALRATRDFFAADGACLAVLSPDRLNAKLRFVTPRRETWDRHRHLLVAFLRRERPQIPTNVLLVPFRRRNRSWATIGLSRSSEKFERGTGHDLSRVAATLSELIHRIDRERTIEVRGRIDKKIMEQLHPKDLFYQILHGLRSLTNYDHSSALLIGEEGGEALELVAEQIAHTKSKSRRIGLRLPLTPEVRGLIGVGAVYGFDREGDVWRQWTGEEGSVAIARLLDYNQGKEASAGGAARARESNGPRREESMLCAPLPTGDGTLGLLKVSTCHAGNLGEYEAELLERFMPQASVAIQNLQRTESLQRRIVASERKHAVAELARGVSHDVNNAIGAVLPLAQQLAADLRSGRIEPEVMVKDLEQIEQSMKVCQRIFGGMLAFARDSARKIGQGDVRRAIDSTLDILEGGMRQRGIDLQLDVPKDLPAIRGNQADLEQVLLNLMSNARDAMPNGGRLVIRAQCAGDRSTLEVTIEDTGCGIPAEHMSRVQEPFFTTKRHGTGLGLTICRSIVWELQGRISFDSQPGTGTVVRTLLPVTGDGVAPSREEEA